MDKFLVDCLSLFLESSFDSSIFIINILVGFRYLSLCSLEVRLRGLSSSYGGFEIARHNQTWVRVMTLVLWSWRQ